MNQLDLFIKSLENDIKSEEKQNLFCVTSESIRIKKKVLSKAKTFLKQ